MRGGGALAPRPGRMGASAGARKGIRGPGWVASSGRPGGADIDRYPGNPYMPRIFGASAGH